MQPRRRCAIGIEGVRKRFGDGDQAVEALAGVTLEIADNAFFTLLGPSGCGKTTLLRLIAGFEQADAGRILLFGEDIGGLPPNRRPVNTVFQHYALFPHMTVAENVAFGLERLGRPRAEIEATVRRMLELVKLGPLAGRRPAQLSGGQQQRVALARALAPHPRVLLLDEPLSALDLKLRREMRVELKQLQEENGITFLFVTHDQEEALTMSDRIAVMSEGRVQQVGSPQEIYDRPRNRFVAEFIGQGNFLPVTIERIEGGTALCRTGFGARLVAPASRELAAGTRAILAIRPERLRLTAPGEAGAALCGRIERLVYVGSDTDCRVRLEGGPVVEVRLRNAGDGVPPAGPGAPVGIAFDPAAARLLPEEG